MSVRGRTIAGFREDKSEVRCAAKKQTCLTYSFVFLPLLVDWLVSAGLLSTLVALQSEG